jgi:hypothetical protein
MRFCFACSSLSRLSGCARSLSAILKIGDSSAFSLCRFQGTAFLP